MDAGTAREAPGTGPGPGPAAPPRTPAGFRQFYAAATQGHLQSMGPLLPPRRSASPDACTPRHARPTVIASAASLHACKLHYGLRTGPAGGPEFDYCITRTRGHSTSIRAAPLLDQQAYGAAAIVAIPAAVGWKRARQTRFHRCTRLHSRQRPGRQVNGHGVVRPGRTTPQWQRRGAGGLFGPRLVTRQVATASRSRRRRSAPALRGWCGCWRPGRPGGVRINFRQSPAGVADQSDQFPNSHEVAANHPHRRFLVQLVKFAVAARAGKRRSSHRAGCPAIRRSTEGFQPR